MKLDIDNWEWCDHPNFLGRWNKDLFIGFVISSEKYYYFFIRGDELDWVRNIYFHLYQKATIFQPHQKEEAKQFLLDFLHIVEHYGAFI